MQRRQFLNNSLKGALAVGFSTTWACRSGPSADTVSTGFPVLDAEGSPGDLGLQHGRAFAAQIARNLEFYFRWLSDGGDIPRSRLLDVAAPFGDLLSRHQRDLFEEIKGIAEGSGRSLEEILMMNARTDMLVMLRHHLFARAEPGCTALALRHRTEAGSVSMALGQNWDWNTDMAEAPVILRLRPDRGPALITLTEAGMVGKIGFNEFSLGVCLNFLSHDSQDVYDTYGVPVHCLLRAVMGCKTMEEAKNLVAQSPRCASANFLIAQHHGETADAVDLEWTPRNVGELPMEDDVLVHTNHFKHANLTQGCLGMRSPSSPQRDRTAMSLAYHLATEMPDPVARMQAVLESRDHHPLCISRAPMLGTTSATLAGIVMDLTHDRAYLTQGAPHQANWIELQGVTQE